MLHLGTPCTRWSVARTSSASSTCAADRLGLLCARRSAVLIRLCHVHHVYGALENPASSKFLQWRPLRTQVERQRAVSVTLHMCAYGAAWLKPTTVVGTLPVTFVENGKKENCWRTSLAGRYPPRLCRAWAALADAAAPANARADGGEAPLSEWWERGLAACQDFPPPERCVVPTALVDRRLLERPRPDRQCWGRSYREEIELARAHRAGLRHRAAARRPARPPPRRQA